jgi:hypothetical protein
VLPGRAQLEQLAALIAALPGADHKLRLNGRTAYDLVRQAGGACRVFVSAEEGRPGQAIDIAAIDIDGVEIKANHHRPATEEEVMQIADVAPRTDSWRGAHLGGGQ